MARLRSSKKMIQSLLLDDGLRRCAKCRRDRHISNFRPRNASYCIDCMAWIARMVREGPMPPPTITIETLMILQNGLCAICAERIDHGGKHAYDLDHIEGTNVICGLLCPNCNTGIGKLMHNVAILEDAIAYVEQRHEKYFNSLSPEQQKTFLEDEEREWIALKEHMAMIDEHESVSATLWEGHF